MSGIDFSGGARAGILASLVAICCPALAQAQASAPRITHVQPPGAQKGSSVEIVVTGSFLDNAETLHFNFPGVKVEPIGETKAVDPKGKGMKTPDAPKTRKFKVALPADAPLGIQDVRVVTKAGISNPRAFAIGDLIEVMEKENNDDVDKAQRIELNSTINGVVQAPTDVDYYVFNGKKGQRVVVSCLTTSIDSRLPAQLQLYSSVGSQLAQGRAYWNDDAVLDATLPADGEYHVRLSSFTYTQGGADYFYRLTIATTPWIDAVSPLAVEPGKETKLTVWGRNLPGGVADPSARIDGRPLEKAIVTVKAPNDPKKLQRLQYSGARLPPSAALDGMELRLKNEAGASNPFLLTYASSAVVEDAGNNDTPEKAQKLTLPCEVSGRIEKTGDRDWYRFELKKGETIRIEVLGERLGSPHNLFFQVSDEQGKSFPEQDDNPETTSTLFYTRNDDPPTYRFTAAADGAYSLRIGTRESFSLAGPRYFYLARIGKEEPDFRIVALPAENTPQGMTLGQGGSQAWTLFVFRDGGFNGEITLSAESLPAGVTMSPQKIAFGQKTGGFVLSAAAEAPPSVAPFRVVGSATVAGKKLVREVRPASITWVGAPNTVLITRLDREMVLAIRGQAPYKLAAENPEIKVIQGEKISIPVRYTAIRSDFKLPVQVLALNPPPGLVSQNISLSPDKKSGTLTLTGKTPTPPGIYNLVLRGQTAPIGKGAPKGPQPPNLVEAARPITLTIVPKQLAKLSVGKAAKLIAGGKAELMVRVERQFDFPTEFKIEVMSNKKEVSAATVTIHEGSNEAKVMLSAAPGAKVGTTAQLIIRATAMFADTPIVHEVKGINVTVTK